MEKLADIIKRKSYNAKKKYQPTYHQHIALKIAEGFDDLGNIGMYMGIVKRKGAEFCKLQFEYIINRKDIDNKIGYFLWLIKKKNTTTVGKPHTN